MALVYQNNTMILRDTTVRVTVPDNPIAKLMYYLDCICCTIELGYIENLGRLRDYKNHYLLTHYEKQELVKLCRELHPGVLDDKVFFHNNALCGDLTNKFYNVTSVSQTLAVTSTVLVGGEMLAVKKIMTYKSGWLDENYYIPMQVLTNPSTIRSSSTCNGKCFCKGMKIAALALLCPIICPLYCLYKVCKD